MRVNNHSISVDLVLEAFEYELSLLVFVLSNSVFSVDVVLFVVEHVVAKVKNRPPIHLCSLPLLLVGALVELDEFPYLSLEVGFF